MGIERVGVIGAGQMGMGIAHVLSLAGIDVVLEDIDAQALAKARETIEKNMHRQAARGLIKDDLVAPALARIHVSPSVDDMRGPRLGVEGGGAGQKKKTKDIPTL